MQQGAPSASAAGEKSLRAVAHEVYSQKVAHPVEEIQGNWLRDQLETKHYTMGNIYGSYLPMQLRMEVEIVSQAQRHPGIPSSNVGMETLLGRDETLDFEDFMGLPQDSEYGVDTRGLLEKKHGLGPRRGVHARLGGPPVPNSQPPRSDVAMAKEFGLW